MIKMNIRGILNITSALFFILLVSNFAGAQEDTGADSLETIEAASFDFESSINLEDFSDDSWTFVKEESTKDQWLLTSMYSVKGIEIEVYILEFYNSTYFQAYLRKEVSDEDLKKIKDFQDSIIIKDATNAAWGSHNKIIIIKAENISDLFLSSLLSIFPSDLEDYNLAKSQQDKQMIIASAKLISASSCKAIGSACSMFDIPLSDESYWTYECCSGYCADGVFSNTCASNPLGNSCRSSKTACVINGGTPVLDDSFQSPECCSDWCMDDELNNYCGLTEGQSDCDKGISDFSGYKCIPGLHCSDGTSGDNNDFCCTSSLEWDGTTCSPPKVINQAYWSQSQADTGDTVTLNVITSGYPNGQSVEFRIYEADIGGDQYLASKFASISSNVATATWTVAQGDDGLTTPEYVFTAVVGSNSKTSSGLSTLIGYNGWDCDFNSHCSTDFALICDGNTGWFDGESEGCCLANENWNGESKFCNDAIEGKAYGVTTRLDGVSQESAYSNKKLLFRFSDRLLTPSCGVIDAVINLDAAGDFRLNPEQYISTWNNNIQCDWTIKSVYVIDELEIVGSLSNSFNNGWLFGDDSYKDGKRFVKQYIRVHTDKRHWKGNDLQILSASQFSAKSMNPAGISDEAPVLDKDRVISSLSSESPINAEKVSSVRWEGTLKIEKGGEYQLLPKILGGYRLYLDSRMISNDWGKNKTDEERITSINLDEGEYNLTIEYYNLDEHNAPVLLWRRGDETFKPVPSSNLIRKSIAIQKYDFDENILRAASSDIDVLSQYSNNNPDYQISFIEEPNQRGTSGNPVILVHGLNGESGYWLSDNTDQKLQSYNYDVWGFYYPNNQEINYSAALLADGIQFVKEKTSKSKVSIIAHSLGGVVSRGYIENHAVIPSGTRINYRGDVEKLITLGSPFYGSHLSNRIAFDTWIDITEELERFLGADTEAPIYHDLAVGSEFTWNLNYNFSQPPTKYYTIVGTADNILPVPFEDDDSDSLVSVTSANLYYKNVSMIAFNVNHANLKGERAPPQGFLVGYNSDRILTAINLILNDAPESIVNGYLNIAEGEGYYKIGSGQSDPFPFPRGSVLVKISPLYDSNVQTVSLDKGGTLLPLEKNPDTGIWYHKFNDNPICITNCGLSVPTGTYNVIVDGFDSGYDLFVPGGGTVLLNIEVPPCMNGIQDGNELGIDCGGTCTNQNSEQCNGVDDNNNCVVNEGNVCLINYYCDIDSDNVRSNTSSSCNAYQCMPVGCSTSAGTDCNDFNASIKPSASETCNNVDDNCNSNIDENVKNTYYRDFDSDTYGNNSNTLLACVVSPGYVTDHSDCNDLNVSIHPGATELCNGRDDDCDGAIDEGGVCPPTTYYCDNDADTFRTTTPSTCNSFNCIPLGCSNQIGNDCNDNNASIKPTATETCNTIDDNCNGVSDEGVKTTFYRDSDNDNYGTPSNTVILCTAPSGYVQNALDCNDLNASIHPNAQELCNGQDETCNGIADEGEICPVISYYCDTDNDSFVSEAVSGTCDAFNCVSSACQTTPGVDCNDDSSSVSPSSPEVCNNIDDNCGGTKDEQLSRQCGVTEAGACTLGTESCSAGSWVSCNAILPSEDIFDGIDNDCDLLVDENNNCAFGSTTECGQGDIGECSYGQSTCTNGDWGACVGEIDPSTELCDSKDNDCNGIIDDNGACLNLIMPLTNMITEETKIPVNITLSPPYTEIYYTDESASNPREKRLCDDCSGYGNDKKKFISLKDGFHNLTFKAKSSQKSDIRTPVEIMVDSKEPKIKSTEPKNKGYTNGSFIIQYQDDNPKKISLEYGTQRKTRSDCPYNPDETTQTCLFNVDVSPYNNQPLNYRFTIEDIANQTDESKSLVIYADTIAPTINNIGYSLDKSRVKFNITISEPVELEYYDHNENRPKWKSLCSNCAEYIKTKSFSKGVHNLSIRATDNVYHTGLRQAYFNST